MKMKCPVCNKLFNGAECPRCEFPVVESPNPGALRDMMRSQIESYRTEFQQSIRVSLTIFYWKDENDKVVIDHEQSLSFGSYYDLRGKKVFLPQQFARIPDEENVELLFSITANDQTRTKKVTIQNLKEAALQTVGIEANDEYQFRVLLKNTNNSETVSAWQAIFDE